MERSHAGSWLSELKQELMETEEWRAVSRHLLANVEGRLEASGLAKFGEFDDQAKLHTLRSATGALQDTSDFKLLSERVSSAVDRTLSERTTQRAMAGGRAQTSPGAAAAATTTAAAELNPVDDVMLECCTCAEGILQRWPDLAATAAWARACVNRAAPPPLRRAYWRARWRRGDALASEFARRCATSPAATLSPHDSDIGRRVQSVLAGSEGTRRGLAAWAPGSSHGLLAVKRLLSAYHACSPQRQSMQMSEATVHRSIPFVHAMLLGRGTVTGGESSLSVERLSDDVIGPMLGAFAGFEESLPPVCKALSVETAKSSADQVARDVDALLAERDPRLREHLVALLVAPTTPETPGGCSAPAPTTGTDNTGAPFYKYLRNLLHPYWKVLFSGFLPLEVVCFLWEQLWVFETLATPPHTYLAVATTTWLLLLSDWLVETYQVFGFGKCLEERSRSLRVDDFRSKIGQLFLDKLQSSQVDGADGTLKNEPLRASTVPGDAAPWLYWTKDERKRRLVEERAAAQEYRVRMLSRARHEAEDARRREEERTKRVLHGDSDGDATPQPVRPARKAMEPGSAAGQSPSGNEDLRRENAMLRERAQLLKQYVQPDTEDMTPTPPPPPAPGPTTVASVFSFPNRFSPDISRGSSLRPSSTTTTHVTEDGAEDFVRRTLQNVGGEVSKFVLGSSAGVDISALREAYSRDLLTVELDLFGENLTKEQWRSLSPGLALERRQRVKKETLRRRVGGDGAASERPRDREFP